jgi:hypothetical protein
MRDKGFYPLPLVWNSGFFDSHFEHLGSVRQSEFQSTLAETIQLGGKRW